MKKKKKEKQKNMVNFGALTNMRRGSPSGRPASSFRTRLEERKRVAKTVERMRSSTPTGGIRRQRSYVPASPLNQRSLTRSASPPNTRSGKDEKKGEKKHDNNKNNQKCSPEDLGLSFSHAVSQVQEEGRGSHRGDGYLRATRGVSIDPATDAIAVVDSRFNRIVVLGAKGEQVRCLSKLGRGLGNLKYILTGGTHFDGPYDVAHGADSVLYITDSNRQRVVAMRVDGKVVQTMSTNRMPPTGVALAREHLYMTSYLKDKVVRFALAGPGVGQLDVAWETKSIDGPRGLCAVPATAGGKAASKFVIYVVERHKHRLVKIDGASGELLGTLCKGPGAGSGQLFKPTDVCYDAGKLYVTDTGNHRVVVLDEKSGECLGSFGAKGHKAYDHFTAPFAIDARSGRVVITSDNKVTVFHDHTAIKTVVPPSSNVKDGLLAK